MEVVPCSRFCFRRHSPLDRLNFHHFNSYDSVSSFMKNMRSSPRSVKDGGVCAGRVWGNGVVRCGAIVLNSSHGKKMHRTTSFALFGSILLGPYVSWYLYISKWLHTSQLLSLEIRRYLFPNPYYEDSVLVGTSIGPKHHPLTTLPTPQRKISISPGILILANSCISTSPNLGRIIKMSSPTTTPLAPTPPGTFTPAQSSILPYTEGLTGVNLWLNDVTR